MGCQAAIAAQSVEQKGHYALAVKGNQGALYTDIQEFFATARAAGFRGVKPIPMRRWRKGTAALRCDAIGLRRWCCRGLHGLSAGVA